MKYCESCEEWIEPDAGRCPNCNELLEEQKIEITEDEDDYEPEDLDWLN
jgi:uncharacterized protein with PIN domain